MTVLYQKISIYPVKFPIDLFLVICSYERLLFIIFNHWIDDHYCRNSLSSLCISSHHCTFCASLHIKTSPA